MRQKIFFILVSFIFCSNAFVSANYLDATFTGDTLVVGGITKNQPDRLSINLYGADIIGSGWDTELLNQLTPNKYNHVLFEHVGMSMYQSERNSDYYVGVSKVYFNLLRSGGSLDFLSWGYFFDDEKYPLSYLLRADGAPVVEIAYNNGSFLLSYVESALKDFVAKIQDQLLGQIRNNGYILDTVHDLAKAGFVDIKIKREENGVLGFTRSHGSLHISARKPID